jgi:hypothetical protein
MNCLLYNYINSGQKWLVSLDEKYLPLMKRVNPAYSVSETDVH